MTDVLDGVRDHYRTTDLTERLKAALTAPRAGGRAAHATAAGCPRSVSHPRARRDRRAGQVGWDHRRRVGVVMGPDFGQLAANLGRNLMEGRVGTLTAVFEAATTNT
jgi:hypothetical protein